jgi:dinuclear metal center YbgI/SA1388 family protein
MKIAEIITYLETIAPPAYQENYDNCGLLTGSPHQECGGVLVTLDATEDVILEAIAKGCNLVVAHHPVIFSGLKKITGSNYVEKTIITAIKHDIAIYAIHTNLDNVIHGVNGRLAEKLELINVRILHPKEATLKKLHTFVPASFAEKVRNAIFEAGGGQIGNYSEASFNSEGTGTFKAGHGTDPFVGEPGKRHHEHEVKIEIIYPVNLQNQVIQALCSAHPYEEVAYDIIALSNLNFQTGSGLIGELPEAMDEFDLLKKIKHSFALAVIKHTGLLGRKVKKVALCGGAGSFLIGKALSAGADWYITSDIKYHEFFDANDKMVIADIGHFESEQFTIDLLLEFLLKKFPTFALRKSETNTNPVRYFVG